MTAIAASAPGKIILFGEHAVVYGRPAIAVPVTQVQAKSVILANPLGPSGQIEIDAPEIDLQTTLDRLPGEHPLALAFQGVLAALGINHIPAMRLRITSSIPIASGLGSGAAVTVSIARALSAFLGHPLADDQVNAIAFRVDQAYHGSPSGIDNTVITYAQPIFFRRGQPFERLTLAQPLTFVIADSGIPSPTRLAVGDVRQHWLANPTQYDRLFDQIGEITDQARIHLETGDFSAIGVKMTENQELLGDLGVSSAELDNLVSAALQAGALGAKLCGAGRGGNMIALVEPSRAESIAAALRTTGAVRTIITQVS